MRAGGVATLALPKSMIVSRVCGVLCGPVLFLIYEVLHFCCPIPSLCSALANTAHPVNWQLVFAHIRQFYAGEEEEKERGEEDSGEEEEEEEEEGNGHNWM